MQCFSFRGKLLLLITKYDTKSVQHSIMSAETAIINGLLTMVCVLNNKSAGRDTTAHAFIREPFVFWLEKKTIQPSRGMDV